MALYRFEAKVISRGAGRSSVRAAAYRSGHTVTAAAAYRAGDRIANDNTGQVHDFSRKGGVVGSEIMLPAGAPIWMADRQKLWNAVELVEKRIDAQLARDFVISIPHELSPAQRREVVRDFVYQAFVSKGLPVDISWHSPERKSGLNHHAHVMMPFRVANENGFAKTKLRAPAGAPFDYWKEELQGLRVLWAETANRHLERAGLEIRIDHRSLADRGIDRIPEPKLGPLATHVIEKDGRMSKAGEDRQNAAELNHLTAEAKRDHARAVAAEAEAKVADLDAVRGRREKQQVKTVEEVEREQIDARLTREQAGTKQLAADEKQRREHQAAAARAADDDELDAAKEKIRHEERDKFHLDSRSAEDAKKIRQSKARINDGDLNNAAERYQIALGDNYNFRDPYGSMANAAGAEHAAFIRQREELKQSIAAEKDPLQKQILEFRRKIELSDHMAQGLDRLSGISAAIAGRRDAPQAISDRNNAATWREYGTNFRVERNQLIEQLRAREAAKEQPQPQKSAGREEPTPPKNPPGGGGSPMPPDLRQEPTQAQGRQPPQQPTPEQRQPPQRVPETAQVQPGQGVQPTAQQAPQRGQEADQARAGQGQAPNQPETQQRGVKSAPAQPGQARQGALDPAQQPGTATPAQQRQASPSQGQPAAREQQPAQERAQSSDQVAGRARRVLSDDERQAIEDKHRIRNDALDQQAAQRSQPQRSTATARPAEQAKTDNREQSDTRQEQAGRSASREQTDATRQTVADRHQQRNEALDHAAQQARVLDRGGRSRS